MEGSPGEAPQGFGAGSVESYQGRDGFCWAPRAFQEDDGGILAPPPTPPDSRDDQGPGEGKGLFKGVMVAPVGVPGER